MNYPFGFKHFQLSYMLSVAENNFQLLHFKNNIHIQSVGAIFVKAPRTST